mmetsp:Transcript_35432/g.92235  ORF Transcript_35432/g.92235 Transcript_35432/m.92235 type:complete len:761 (-) Transcript_35432:573-2855(-)
MLSEDTKEAVKSRQVLNKRKTILKELLRTIDKSGKGVVDEKKLRECVKLSEFPLSPVELSQACKEFRAVDGSFGVDSKKFLRSIGLATPSSLPCSPSSPLVPTLSTPLRPSTSSYLPRPPTSGRPSTSRRPPTGLMPPSSRGSLSGRPVTHFDGNGEPILEQPKPQSADGDVRPNTDILTLDEVPHDLSVPEDKQLLLSSKTKEDLTPKLQERVDSVIREIREKLKSKVNMGPYELRQSFRFCDKDGNGSVNLNEFELVLHECGIEVSDEDRGLLFKTFDQDHDGALNYYEFIDAMIPKDYGPALPWSESDLPANLRKVKPPRDLEEKMKAKRAALNQPIVAEIREKIHARISTGPFQLRRSFKYFDRDGSGEIDQSEFFNVMKDMGMVLNDEQTQELFRLFDLDGDGRLSYYEFVMALLPQEYSSWDHPLGEPRFEAPYEFRKDLSVQTNLAERAADRYKKLERALRKADPDEHGTIDRKLFVESLSGLSFLRLSVEEIRNLLRRVDPAGTGQIQYGDLLNELRKDEYMEGWGTEFLKPRSHRSSGDIVAWTTEYGAKGKPKLVASGLSEYVTGGKAMGQANPLLRPSTTSNATDSKRSLFYPPILTASVATSQTDANNDDAEPVPQQVQEKIDKNAILFSRAFNNKNVGKPTASLPYNIAKRLGPSYIHGVRQSPRESMDDLLKNNYQKDWMREHKEKVDRLRHESQRRKKTFGGPTAASALRNKAIKDKIERRQLDELKSIPRGQAGKSTSTARHWL